MELELLEKIAKYTEQIANNTEPKQSMHIIVSAKTTSFRTSFNPPIELKRNKKYEIALKNLDTYYSFPNIDSTNNCFRYTPDGEKTWFDVDIPEGSYEIKNINEYLKRQLIANGHFDEVNEQSPIIFSANVSTLKAVLTIERDYLIDFNVSNSVCTVLGFNKKIYSAGYHESENIVNIMSVNSIFVKLSIITGSYVNGKSQPVIYSFFPNANPGYKIIETPSNPVYLPLTLNTISSMETTLTDQNDKQLNLRGDEITIRFDIREA